MSSLALKPVQVQECQTVTKYVPFEEDNYTPSITQEELETLGHAGKYYDALKRPPSVWVSDPLPSIVLNPPGALPPGDHTPVPLSGSGVFLALGLVALFVALKFRGKFN